jgi:plastocyanin
VEELKMKRLSALVLLCVFVVLLTACGGSAASPDSSGELVIDLSEFAFDPDNIEIEAGQKVTFILNNSGEKEHEFMIGREVRIVDDVPDGFEHDFFEGLDVHHSGGGMIMGLEMDEMAMDEEMAMEEGGETDEMAMEEGDEHEDDEMAHHGFMVMLPEGSDDGSISFTVTADKVGEWEIACFEDDGQHYEDGMKGKLVVTES